jgi:hypothetical protein
MPTAEATMNKLDSVYYEAVTRATEDGVVPAEALKLLHDNARKFAIIDEPGESARFYERIFSLWRTIATQPVASDTKAQFAAALSEYIELLSKLGRHERVATVYDAMKSM